MSSPTLDLAARPAGQRTRPRLHFTAQRGFTNDPHGIIHHDGEYHMFFQHNPDDTRWSPGCHWGHAVSADLIHWRQAETALTPSVEEVGCWSGSAVVDDQGPVIAYTRVSEPDWSRGAVALARPSSGMHGWVREEIVIAGPPPGYDFVAFRDPHLRREAGTWKAVVGGGIAGLGACAVQYSSPDLRSWTLDGLVANRPSEMRKPVWTGKAWECPQLLQVDGQWVLIVGVWEDHVIHNVVYAIGELHGHRLQPRAWGTLTHGRQLYATTTFADAAGRPCAMSWMREIDDLPPDGSPWCSAMSLPHVLSIRGDRLVVSQHPGLDEVLPTRAVLGQVGQDGAADLGTVSRAWRVQVDLAATARGAMTLQVNGHDASWSVGADVGVGELVVKDPSGPLMRMPLPRPAVAGRLEVVADCDICEITWSAGDGVGAVRIPASPSSSLTLLTEGVRTTGVRVGR